LIFTLVVKFAQDGDLSVSEDYEMYLSALRQDILSIGIGSKVTASGLGLKLETTRPISASDLKEALKPAFSDSMFEKLRLVSIVEGEEGAGTSSSTRTPGLD
jgi:hypothetical protein